MSSTFTFRQGDKVRLATPDPSPTDLVGEVIEIGPPTANTAWVRVKWPTGNERTYHPAGLTPAPVREHCR